MNSGDDYDIEDVIPANKLSTTDISMDSDNGKRSDEASDKDLMPPPSLPVKPAGSDTKMQTDTSSGDEEIKKIEKREWFLMKLIFLKMYSDINIKNLI